MCVCVCVSHFCSLFLLFFLILAVIATKGRESDYEGVKDDVMKVLAELNVMIQRSVASR